MASVPISLRVPAERLSVIDRGASVFGLNRTEFLINCGYEAAVAAMSERPIIQMDDELYDAFISALEAPTHSTTRCLSLFDLQFAIEHPHAGSLAKLVRLTLAFFVSLARS